ncbi:MAG: hypothetical protein JWN45_2668 [Acidobacteriaceae bacterium]|nr:hypothetical protein [Acidobacteriaceae bacterium]
MNKLIINEGPNQVLLELNSSQVQAILAFLSLGSRDAVPIQSADSPTQVEQMLEPMTFVTSPAGVFRMLLQEKVLRTVEFLLERRGNCFNDELAMALEVEDATTSAFLGKITRKLMRVGITAQGHRGFNWYGKQRTEHRTLLTVRPDVLAFFREALAKEPDEAMDNEEIRGNGQ